MTAKTTCLSCDSAAIDMLIDFGPQPPSNRFTPAGQVDADAHPLKVGACTACGLIQLVDPMSAAMVKSRHAWLTYNEPENHLDALAERLVALPGLHKNSRVVGLTYKDDTLLARMRKLFFESTARFDMAADFGVTDPCAGLETIQAEMTDARADALIKTHGRADMVIVRHVLEHAHNPQAFLSAVRKLAVDGGYVVFEMPDAAKFINACDYTFVWEEHITYFTPATLRGLVERAGFNVVDIVLYPFPLEDSLIAILRVAPVKTAAAAAQPDLAPARNFARAFPERRDRTRAYFGGLHKQGKRAAVFGAGHLAAKFVNLYGLKDYFVCAIDDSPHKQGLAMPGSGLPIQGSAVLPTIDVCMLSLSPESEQKVVQKQSAYRDAGGTFASIFALSTLALKVS